MKTPQPSSKTLEAARIIQQKSICSYSNFPVGSSLETYDNIIISGHNIESASYGLTICAERVAIFSALAQGHRNFTHIVIVTNTGSYPCGACRQILYEFCPNAWITIATPTTAMTTCQVKDLMPYGFGQFDLSPLKKDHKV